MILSFRVCSQACSKYAKKDVSISWAISPEKHGDEVDFMPADGYESFLQVYISLWVSVARDAQSTQNKKFGISLQYLKENVKVKVDLLLVDKHQKFLQINTIILGVYQLPQTKWLHYKLWFLR